MCFITNKLEKHIADKPIICYKQVLFAEYRRRKFRFWKKAVIKARSCIMDYEYIPWKDNPIIQLEVGWIKRYDGIEYKIEAGYHSYTSPFTNASLTTVKCIIPIGSTYYTNGKEYVSSNIIMTNEVV